MKKRKLWISVLAVMIACGLTACSGDKKQEAAETNAAATEKKETETASASTAPDFTARLSDGTEFTLSEAKGKVVLINFWATWCPPCVGEMPAFEKLYAEYGDQVQILAVDCMEDTKTVDAFIEENGYTFPIAYDVDGSIEAKYPTEGIPYTVVIGTDGSVADEFVGSRGADAQYQVYKEAIEKAMEAGE